MYTKKISIFLVLLCCFSGIYGAGGDSISYFSKNEHYYKGTEKSLTDKINLFFEYLSQTYRIENLEWEINNNIKNFKKYTIFTFECEIDNTFSFNLVATNFEPLFFSKGNIKEYKITYAFSYFPPLDESIMWPDYKGQIKHIEEVFEVYTEEHNWKLRKKLRT